MIIIIYSKFTCVIFMKNVAFILFLNLFRQRQMSCQMDLAEGHAAYVAA